MFYLIDKPLGMTSYDVIRKLKKMLQIQRIGHAGTLDPLATGLLLIATHNSTKLLPLLDSTEKRYIFTVNLTGTTASLDLGTEIIPCDTENMEKRTAEELMRYILSQREQIPPRYSALHIDGKRAYELARAGEEFDIQPRPISVRDIIIHTYSPPTEVTIELTISSGGYIRSFAPVIGGFFGLSGAGYITSLRRTELHTRDTTLTLRDASDLDSFDITDTLDLSRLFPGIPEITIGENTYLELKNGKVIKTVDGLQGNIGQKYFFKYMDFFTSLVEYGEDGFHILRNDI